MISSIRQFTANLSLQKKLMFTYIAVVVIPVLLVGLMLTNSLRQMALDAAVRQSGDRVDNIKKRTIETLRVPIDLSNQILIDKKLRKIVNTQFYDTYDVVKAYSEYTQFNDYVRLYHEIASIRFYTQNATMLNNWEFFHENEAIMSNSWYQKALAAQGRLSWYFIPDETQGNRQILSLIRKIAYHNDKSYGMLIIGVDTSRLRELLNQEPFETMVVTDDGYVAAAKDQTMIGRTLDQLNLNVGEEGPSVRNFEAVYNHKLSKVVVERFVPEGTLNGIRIISFIPFDGIVKDANRISRLGFLMIMFSLCVAAILIVLFSNVLSKRFKRLSKEIKKVSAGNFFAFSTIDGGDEIGQLSRHFHVMVGNIRHLMEEVTAANDQKNTLVVKQKEIKLKMLASQIHPHFLFNTLESIRMKAHIRGETEIAYAVMLLGKLMRKNLDIGGDKMPLADEIDQVRSYLEIQKFRYGERLNYILEIEEGTLAFKTYRLVLQPLVENAVIHGLERKEENGTVIVQVTQNGDKLMISVTDDGVGISEHKLRSIVDQLDNPEDEANSRIGLRNVHQRIRLSYGGEYGLSIESKIGLGTRVTIIIPAEGESDV
ncbi:MAG: histidine kinase [Cohnella sp.]|nr:histidine kinase [Cohnella sp.]